MDPLQLLLKKRIIHRSNRSLISQQKTINYSTTNASNLLHQSIPSSTTNTNYEQQLKKFEEYSKYHFINNNNNNNNNIFNIKSGLSLLKEGINSIINNNNSNCYIKLSPIKKNKNYNSMKTNRENKKINIRNIMLRNENTYNNNSIWDKLKNSISVRESYKYGRSNIRESIKKFEYLQKQRNINRLIKICDLKKNRINNIKRLYEKEKNILDKMKYRLKKSYEHVQNVYEENIEPASSFIFTTAIKENNGNSQLIIDKKKLKKEIIELERKIKIFEEEKNNILNWIFLLIKIKENKKILPKYYVDILDKNISYDYFLKKYNNLVQAKEEYNRINSYKKNLVFIDIYEFNDKFNSINQRILKSLDYNINESNDKNEDDKNKLNDLINQMKPHKKENILRKELNELKIMNAKLKEEYTYRYNYNKKIWENNKGELYFFIIKLLEEFKKLKFNIIEVRINYFDKEEKIILDIIEFFEINLNFLLEEKMKYISDDDLREKYITIENKVKKERRILNVIKQQKINLKLLESKKEKIEKRTNNKNYLPYKKIDYNHYLRMKNKSKKRDEKEEDEYEIKKQYILYF